MTILLLDHAQRLHLHALLGMQECNVAETRAHWRLQDALQLNDTEKKELGFSIQTVNGNEVYNWDQEKSVPMREYELSDADIGRIEKAIQGYPRHSVGRFRAWLEPVLAQLPASADGDGKPVLAEVKR